MKRMPDNKHEHLCRVCSNVSDCWMDCGYEVVGGEGLGGTILCDDCARTHCDGCDGLKSEDPLCNCPRPFEHDSGGIR